MNVVHHEANVLGGILRDRFSDLKLVTECGKSVSVHKVVVAAVSPVLCDILISKEVSEIPIRNVKFSALKHLIDFIYERKVILSSSEEFQDFKDAYKLLELSLGSKINEIIERRDNNTANNSAVESSNQNTEQFKCKNCEKEFKFKKQLIRHVREVHNKGDRRKQNTYICERCNTVYKVNIDYRTLFEVVFVHCRASEK